MHSRARTRSKRNDNERRRTARFKANFAELEALLLSRSDLCKCDQLQEPCKVWRFRCSIIPALALIQCVAINAQDAIFRSAIMTIKKLIADIDELNEQVQSLLSHTVVQA